MQIILFLVFGVINALIADKKGFNPAVWFFAAGLLGLIVVLIMPSANAVKESDTELYQKRIKDGNIAGTIILGVVVIAVAILIISIISM